MGYKKRPCLMRKWELTTELPARYLVEASLLSVRGTWEENANVSGVGGLPIGKGGGQTSDA